MEDFLAYVRAVAGRQLRCECSLANGKTNENGVTVRIGTSGVRVQLPYECQNQRPAVWIVGF